MLEILKFLSRDKSSKNVAKDRLKLVLVHDRANCSPEVLEMVKEDLLKSLAKYLDIDEAGLDIRITKTESESDGKPALVANIPIINVKRGQ